MESLVCVLGMHENSVRRSVMHGWTPRDDGCRERGTHAAATVVTAAGDWQLLCACNIMMRKQDKESMPCNKQFWTCSACSCHSCDMWLCIWCTIEVFTWLAFHACPKSACHELHTRRADHTSITVLRSALDPRGCIHHVDANRLPRGSMDNGTGTTIWRATSRSVIASVRSRVHAVTTACPAPLSADCWRSGMTQWCMHKTWRELSHPGMRVADSASHA